MKRKRQSKEEIAHALRRVEWGEKAVEVCRAMGVSEANFVARKAPMPGCAAKRGTK